MSKIITVLVNWLRMSALSMASLAHGVVVKMTGNMVYPTPALPLAALSTAATRVENAWANRANGAQAKQELELAITDLDIKLHQEATYVNGIANGDMIKILSAGFSTTSITRTPAVKPIAPVAPTLKAIGAGKLRVSVPHVAGENNYAFIVFKGTPINIPVIDGHFEIPSGTADVIILPNCSSHEEVSGLIAGQKVTVKAFAHNSAGLSDSSPDISTFIL